MQSIHQTPMAAPGPVVAFTILRGVADPMAAHAEIKEMEADGYYINLGNYDKAIECYQNAIELDPKFPNPWKHMGTSYYQLGNYAKAVECFQRALQLNPDYEAAKEGLALAQANL